MADKRRRRRGPPPGSVDYVEILRRLHALADRHAPASDWEPLRAAFVAMHLANRPANRENIATNEAHRMFDVFVHSPRLLPGRPPEGAELDEGTSPPELSTP